MDKTAKGITIFITLLFSIIIIIQALVLINTGASRPIYIICILIVIYGLAFLLRPSGYKITSDALVICRPFANVRIKKEDIVAVKSVDKDQLKSAIRTFGVGGLFGYYGAFANNALGSMTWYATRRDKAVLITTAANKKIVITPNDPEAFVQAFVLT